jgi:hypothetical protein
MRSRSEEGSRNDVGPETIARILGKEGASSPGMFSPTDLPHKIMDELFLRVLDDTDNAAAVLQYRHLRFGRHRPPHFDDQMKFLLREAPSVVSPRNWVDARETISTEAERSCWARVTASLRAGENSELRKGPCGAFCSRTSRTATEIVDSSGRREVGGGGKKLQLCRLAVDNDSQFLRTRAERLQMRCRVPSFGDHSRITRTFTRFPGTFNPWKSPFRR